MFSNYVWTQSSFIHSSAFCSDAQYVFNTIIKPEIMGPEGDECVKQGLSTLEF